MKDKIKKSKEDREFERKLKKLIKEFNDYFAHKEKTIEDCKKIKNKIKKMIEEEYKKAVEEFIDYAVDNGFLDEEAFDWDFEKKAEYYETMTIYEPNED